MDEWMNGWMDEWMDEWVDGWMDEYGVDEYMELHELVSERLK
jgi:hypothetical protein